MMNGGAVPYGTSRSGSSSWLSSGRYPLVGKEADNNGARSGACSVQAPERRATERRASAADRRFWRALKSERRIEQRRRNLLPPAAGGVDDGLGTCPPGPESMPGSDAISTRAVAVSEGLSIRRELLSTRGASATDETLRRKRLMSMLDAAELRHERGTARRAERPQFVAGIRLQVVRGTRTGCHGTLIDADYIHARAQIELDGENSPVWIGFADLRAAPDE